MEREHQTLEAAPKEAGTKGPLARLTGGRFLSRPCCEHYEAFMFAPCEG
jgi:hypothetical protein